MDDSAAFGCVTNSTGDVNPDGDIVGFEYPLVAALKRRLGEAIGPYVADGIDRDEYLAGIVVVTAAARGMRVPPTTIGLAEHPRRRR